MFIHDNSSKRLTKSLTLNIVSVKLVDPELGITYTGIVYILGVTILSRMRSKDLTSRTTLKYRASELLAHIDASELSYLYRAWFM